MGRENTRFTGNFDKKSKKKEADSGREQEGPNRIVLGNFKSKKKQ